MLFSFYVYKCLACMCACASCSAYSGQKRVLDHLDLQFQRVASHHMGVGPELGSSARAASTLKHQAIPPTPNYL